MQQAKTRGRLLLGASLVAALAGVSGVRAGDCPAKSVQVNVTISAGKITSPAADSSVTIFEDETKGNTKVCWLVSGLFEGYSLNFVTKEGSTAEIDFDKGRSVQGKQGGEEKRLGAPDKGGHWRYLIVLQKNGADIDTLDPEVQVIGKLLPPQ